jgi:sugar lactone lactonase YvrE
MYEVEHLLPVQNQLGEGPRWHAPTQTLYWVNIRRGEYFRYTPATGAVETFNVGQPLGALAFRASGGFVLAVRDGIAFWDKGVLKMIASPESGKPGARFNDAVVDRQGRFWAGTIAEGGMKGDSTSSLYRLDPDGSFHTMETGITVSNGIGWSPDNRTMYYADSERRLIYAYDFDAATGAITNRRNWVRTPEPEVPDGLVVDTEGCVWCAKWGGWKITRYDPEGKPMSEIALPAQYITACTFGGPALDELYVTSAWDRLSPAERAGQQLAGDIFRIRVGVKGFEEPCFAG